MGAGLAVDGAAGRKTRSAIRRFQRQKKLKADGVVGPRTEAALRAAGADPPPGGAGAVHGIPIPPGGSVDLRSYSKRRSITDIRRQLDRQIKASDVKRLHERRQTLRKIFRAVPEFYAGTLYDRLKTPSRSDELSKLFHYRLATPTRNELLKILQDKSRIHRTVTTKPDQRPRQKCLGGNFLLKYETQPNRTRCITEHDREFRKNFVGYNIAEFRAVIDKTKDQIVSFDAVYKDGRTKRFTDSEIASIPKGPYVQPVDSFLMKPDGFIYHVYKGKITYDVFWCAEIVTAMADMRIRAKALKDLFDLGVLAAGFARIIGSYSGLSGVQ